MRIVFMGTPDFAVASLKELVENGKNVVGVITAPDKPAGRGRKLQQSAVKVYAESQGLKVLQPTNLKAPEFIEELSALKPDLQVVVAFRMLPKVVWDLPAKGTINLHGSLLPQYRGAAPINWAIINGETESGATTFFINEKIDTGETIQNVKVPIDKNDSAGTYHDKLMIEGAKLLLDTVNKIESGNAPSTPQDHNQANKEAPKIFKEDTIIDFSKPAEQVYNFIRGLSPYPAAISNIIMDGEKIGVKIFEVELTDEPSKGSGELETNNKNVLNVGCHDKMIRLKSLQIAGKRRMEVSELLNGFKISENAKMG
ncbi:methionyl-tRNA formyltransferase [Owenweeksia hongkongensis]|uniref:methionyl-tRNA formyltransferase n=1 Tax=Owenweeksia hongkongensis TaxID=253245 RepID=UPI003A8D825E